MIYPLDEYSKDVTVKALGHQGTLGVELVTRGADMRVHTEDGWFHMSADGTYPKMSGKWLFFGPSMGRLVEVAEKELSEGLFHLAKVSTTTRRGDYVLYLYAETEDRAQGARLKEIYDGPQGIKFRWWKSEEATRKQQTPIPSTGGNVTRSIWADRYIPDWVIDRHPDEGLLTYDDIYGDGDF